MVWVRLGSVADLQDEEVMACQHDGAQIALFAVDGEIHATDNICTHDYALLTDGYVDDGCVECPLHAARFNLRTGEALCGPAKDPIKVYPVDVRDDDIWVDI